MMIMMNGMTMMKTRMNDDEVKSDDDKVCDGK